MEWAAEGLDVSISQVELTAHLHFYERYLLRIFRRHLLSLLPTLYLQRHQTTSIYQHDLQCLTYVRKLLGGFTPPHLLTHVESLTRQGKYDKHILEDYSGEELEELNKYIDHERDMKFSYAAVKQLEGKYLVQNRVTGQIYESPQFLYMLVGVCLFSSYDKSVRLDYVKRYYDAISLFKISLPTPIMAGVRTPTRQFSSCVLIDCGDSLDSMKRYCVGNNKVCFTESWYRS